MYLSVYYLGTCQLVFFSAMLYVVFTFKLINRISWLPFTGPLVQPPALTLGAGGFECEVDFGAGSDCIFIG